MTKIKNKIIVALSALLVFCLAFSLAMATPTTTKANNENAVTPTVNVETILMDEGASVRTETTNGISSGIRFTMYIKAEYYASLTNPVVGMYIARATDATEEEMKKGALPEKYQHVVATNALAGDAAETVEDTLSFNAVIFNIPEEEFGTALIANGYIVSEGAEVEYASNPQTRSIAQVASMAIANGMDDEVLFNYVDKALENADQTLAFATTSAKFDVIKDDGKTLGLGLTVPNGFTAIVTSSDPEVATVDANGVVTCGTKVGTATIKAQLGNTEVTATVENKAYIINVDETTHTNIYTTDKWLSQAYVSADSEEMQSYTGGYTGNAKKIKAGGRAESAFRFVNPLSMEQLNELSLSYKSVTLWFAISGRDSAGTTYLMSGKNAFSCKVFGSSNKGFKAVDDKVWYQWKISINDYMSLINIDATTGASEIYLFNIYNEGGAEPYFLIGDIELSDYNEFNPYIVNVNETDYAKIDNINFGSNTNARANYIDATELTDFTGEYSGSATRVKGSTTPGYTVKNDYSLAALTGVKAKGYSTVSMWIACDGMIEGTLRFQSESSSYSASFMSKAKWSSNKLFHSAPSTAAHLAQKTWYKASISIDDYISLVTDSTTGLAKSECVLFHAWTWWGNSAGITGDAYFYIGDIFFE